MINLLTIYWKSQIVKITMLKTENLQLVSGLKNEPPIMLIKNSTHFL